MFDSHAAERKYYQLQDSSGVSRCSVNVIKYDLIKTQCFGRLLIADHNDYDLDKNICGTLQKSEKSETYTYCYYSKGTISQVKFESQERNLSLHNQVPTYFQIETSFMWWCLIKLVQDLNESNFKRPSVSCYRIMHTRWRYWFYVFLIIQYFLKRKLNPRNC